MSFLLRIVIAIFILFIVEFVFVKKLKNAAKQMWGDRLSTLHKWLPGIYLVFINIFPVLLIIYWAYSYIFTGTERIYIDNVWWDYLVVYPFWVLSLITVQCFVLFLLLDIIKLALRFLIKSKREEVKSVILKTNWVLVIFFLIYVPLRVIYDYNFVSVRVTEVVNSNLPKELDGFRIALIADVQADKYTDGNRLNNYLNKVNEAKPDLILIAGDLITSTPDFISTSAEHLSQLNAPYGVYSCIGDHDNWAYRGDVARSRKELASALDSVSIPLVHNKNIIFNVDSAQIVVTFVTNTYSEQITDSTLDSLSTECPDCDFKIFLTHQPRIHLMEKADLEGYDLYLAGHTHGGQLTLLFPFINLSPTLIETKYVKGDFYLNNLMVVVNRGLGMSIAPVRYNSSPEITIINLSKL